MKKTLLISLAAASLLASEPIMLDGITVESASLGDVAVEEIKSADTAEVLAKKVPSITLVRRSGIANDIILRGQKRDNINVIIDGGKVYGACPNRMDPPTSHVITGNIGNITVIEGPYDVEHAGTLSGLVFVETVKPQKGILGDLNLGAGSFGYQKLSGTLTGGNDTVRALISASGERSGQYTDGDGNTFADQIDNAIGAGQAAAGNAFRDDERDREAYRKKSLMAKLFIDITDSQELRLGYTANRSDGVLYPNTPMDARYDNSDLYNLQYIIKKLGSLSKELKAEYYYSYVDHPMWTKWRKASLSMGTVTNHLTSTVQGAALKNTTALTDSTDLIIGIDGSLRNWDGEYDRDGTVMGPSIDDADTRNTAVFAELKKRYDNAAVTLGVRYDDTEITSGNDALGDNSYQSIGANIFADYQVMPVLGFFGGIGSASRVPDARELYFQQSGNVIGTPDLDQTTNYEVDLGMKNSYDAFTLKSRVFYSRLQDYIYFNSGKTTNKFENVDATIYGLELSGSWYISETLYADFGTAWQHGTKDDALEGQSNTNLADIPPLKGSVALNWNYGGDNLATVEVVGADEWKTIDDQNGEQLIPAWAILNLKINHSFNKHLSLIAGVDNLFDKAYAVSNTYKDLTLLSIDPNADVMLMNEPGRNVYANLNLHFK